VALSSSAALLAGPILPSAEGGSGSSVPLLRFSPASGSVPARSRVRVDATFAPTLSGDFRFRVFVDPTAPGDAGSSLPAARASRRSAFLAAAAAEVDPSNPALTDWSLVAPNGSMLWCNVFAVAAYPVIAVEDARGLGSREALLTLFPFHSLGNPHCKAAAAAPASSKASASTTSLTQYDASAGADGVPYVALRDKTTLGAGGIPLPLPLPADLWVRPANFLRDSVLSGVAQPVESGAGLWSFALPGGGSFSSARSGGSATRAKTAGSPVPTALDAAAPPTALQLMRSVTRLDAIMPWQAGLAPSHVWAQVGASSFLLRA
jgi:hypothetical protein